jgi:hypothetical protein
VDCGENIRGFHQNGDKSHRGKRASSMVSPHQSIVSPLIVVSLNTQLHSKMVTIPTKTTKTNPIVEREFRGQSASTHCFATHCCEFKHLTFGPNRCTALVLFTLNKWQCLEFKLIIIFIPWTELENYLVIALDSGSCLSS